MRQRLDLMSELLNVGLVLVLEILQLGCLTLLGRKSFSENIRSCFAGA